MATQPLWREPYPDYLALSQLTPLREHFARTVFWCGSGRHGKLKSRRRVPNPVRGIAPDLGRGTALVVANVPTQRPDSVRPVSASPRGSRSRCGGRCGRQVAIRADLLPGNARHRCLNAVGQLAGGVPDPADDGFAGEPQESVLIPSIPTASHDLGCCRRRVEQVSDDLAGAATIVWLGSQRLVGSQRQRVSSDVVVALGEPSSADDVRRPCQAVPRALAKDAHGQRVCVQAGSRQAGPHRSRVSLSP